jgi:hypothetical protein
MNLAQPVKKVSTVERSAYLKAISEPATTATIQHIQSIKFGLLHPSAEDSSWLRPGTVKGTNNGKTWTKPLV